jgi:predicted  nucleic acid-binding Zn-ribbon protein
MVDPANMVIAGVALVSALGSIAIVWGSQRTELRQLRKDVDSIKDDNKVRDTSMVGLSNAMVELKGICTSVKEEVTHLREDLRERHRVPTSGR